MAPTTQISFGRDIQGYNSSIPSQSNNKVAILTTANTNVPLTVPSDAATYLAVFRYSPGIEVFVSVGNTAVIPTSHTFVSTNTDLNPPGYIVKAGQTINFLTTSNISHIMVSFYTMS